MGWSVTPALRSATPVAQTHFATTADSTRPPAAPLARPPQAKGLELGLQAPARHRLSLAVQAPEQPSAPTVEMLQIIARVEQTEAFKQLAKTPEFKSYVAAFELIIGPDADNHVVQFVNALTKMQESELFAALCKTPEGKALMVTVAQCQDGDACDAANNEARLKSPIAFAMGGSFADSDLMSDQGFGS